MAFSPNGVNYGDWQPFTPTSSWTFPSGDGLRTLWVKVKNGVGLDSAPASATVTIDSVAPSAIGFDPDPGSTVIGLRPRLTVSFSEPMDPGTWSDLGLIVQSATGALVAGAYSFDSSTRTGSFVPTTELQRGAPYIVTLGDVRDIAGNRVAFSGSWSITPIAPTALTVKAVPTVLALGAPARLEMTLTGAPFPATVDVLNKTSRAPDFAPLGSIPTNDGRGSLVVAPGMNTTYRFSYLGPYGVQSAQVDRTVLVRRSVVVAGLSRTVSARAKVGSPVRLTAGISPATAGVSISFRLYRFDAVHRKWMYAGSHGRSTDASGRAAYTWTPTTSGTYYWRASVASTPDFANNISVVYRWTVSR